MASIRVGIIGGSGLGDALAKTQGQTAEVDTPFGKPSSPIVLANWQGTDIAILQRHGVGHVYNPSTVNYRANIYALKSLGCTHVIASGAVGSLREEIRPKDLVICDQVIDKTYRRAGTFFDEYLVAHVEMAMPFCPVLREHLISCADAVATRVHAAGMTAACRDVVRDRVPNAIVPVAQESAPAAAPGGIVWRATMVVHAVIVVQCQTELAEVTNWNLNRRQRRKRSQPKKLRFLCCLLFDPSRNRETGPRVATAIWLTCGDS